MTNDTISGMRGSPMPNLEAHGLARKMKLAAALIKEQDELRQRKSELGHEQQRLREEIKRREREHTREWGQAMRAGEEAAADGAIEAAKRRLAEVRKEIGAVSHAGELSDAELKETVAEHREEWDAEVQTKGERILAEAQEIAEALSRKLSETEGLVGVHTWLTSSGQSYTPASPASVSIEQLLHERRRELGLLDVGVLR
jgi:chromosome segregation ATPase